MKMFSGPGVFSRPASRTPHEVPAPLPQWVPPSWLDADIVPMVRNWWSPERADLMELDGEGKVISYRDQITGDELRQDAASARPTFQPNGFNGHACLSFATGQGLRNAEHRLPLGAEVCETFLVCDQQENNTSERWLLQWGGPTHTNEKRDQRRLGKRAQNSAIKASIVAGRGTTFNQSGNTAGNVFLGKHLFSANWVRDVHFQIDDWTPTVSDNTLPLVTLAGPVVFGGNWLGLGGHIIITRGLSDDQRARLKAAILANLLTPAAPKGLSVSSVTASSMTLAHEPVPGASGYEISLDRGKTWTAKPADNVISGISGPQTIQLRAVNTFGPGAIAGTRAGTLVELDPALVALVGASTVQGNHSVSGIPTSSPRISTPGGSNYAAIGFARAGARLRFDQAFEITERAGMGGIGRGGNNGTGGRTLDTYENVLRVIEASRAGVVVVSPERNSIVRNPMMPLEEQKARYASICHRLRLQGRTLMHANILRRADDEAPLWEPGTPFFNALVELNAWQAAYAAGFGETVIDFAGAVSNPQDPTPYSVVPGIYSDGSHYTTKGAWLTSQAIVDAIEEVHGAAWPDLGAGDPAVNFFANPFMSGSDGVLSGATGTAPTGMNLNAATAIAAGFAVSGATVTRDGIPQYAITVTPPGVPGPTVALTFGRSSSFALPLTAGPGTFAEFMIRVERTDDGGGLVGYETSFRNGESPYVELRNNTTGVRADGTYVPMPAIPHRARWGGLLAELITLPRVNSLFLTLRLNPAATAPWTFYTSEWCVFARDHKGNYPEVKKSADYGRDAAWQAP